MGYQQAMKKTSSDSRVSELLLPIVDSAQTLPADEYSMSSEPGEDIDVDRPDVVNKPMRSTPKTGIPAAKKALKDKKRTTDEGFKKTAVSALKSGKVPATKTQVTRIKATKTEVFKNEIIKIIDNASEADAKYSIQVGLYGIRINAQRRVDELIKKQLSGHLTNFVNEKGDVLFNVRFGYFLDKVSVNEALKIYQQKYTGDGYIIKLKRKAKI